MDFYAGIYGLSAAEARGRQAELVELTGPGAVPGPPGRPALGRLEAAAGAGLCPAAPAAAGLPRRADRRHRPGGPPRPVGPAVPPRRRGRSRCSSRRTTWTRPSAAAGSATCTCRKLLALGTPDELKRPAGRDAAGHAPAGDRRRRTRPALLDALRDQPGVREATIFGQSVHALVDDGRTPPTSATGARASRSGRRRRAWKTCSSTLARAQASRNAEGGNGR